MSDIVIDPTSVSPETTARTIQARSAVQIDAGEAVYIDAAGLADLASNASEDEATVRGVAVDTAEAAGQPIVICVQGTVAYGTDIFDPGQAYYVSDTPGGIRPATDLVGTDEYAGFIGLGSEDGSGLVVRPMTPIYRAGPS